MIRIIEIDVERIIKDCGSIREGYSVLLKITRRLLFVPLIIHETQYTIWLSTVSREMPNAGHQRRAISIQAELEKVT
jgi:hypothetical protein